MAEENTLEAKLPELSGKALKAFNKINTGLSSYLGIQKVLMEFYDSIKLIIGPSVIERSYPEKIIFSFDEKLGFNFYIDFSIRPSGGDNPWDLEGNINYGAYNKIDFRHDEKCKICGGTIICNCVRTRSLLSLTVNEHGWIESTNKLEENWILNRNNDDPFMVKEDLKTIMEIHYKTLEYIFLEALGFINEKYKNL
jgi:hypothetical protein